MTVYSYNAVYADAEDVNGTVEAEGLADAIDAAADDLEQHTGQDALSYGTLVEVTIADEEGDVVCKISPVLDDQS